MSRNAVKSLFVAVMASALFAVAALASASAAEPNGLEGDHLVVSQLPVVATAQAVTLVRFNGAGTSDGTNWTLPTTASGSNHPFTLGGESNAVGALARSANGKYITLAGTTAAVGASAEGKDARVVARVNGVGTVDTSTTLGTSFIESKVRGAVSNDGNEFWVTGNGNTTGATPLGGMVYTTLGHSGAPTVIVSREALNNSTNKAFNNFRSVQIAGGNLYSGSEKGTAGVYQVAGLPTSATLPTAVTTFTGEIDPISELPLEHVAGSGTVDLMYVAKENDGIYKYSLSGSTWTERGKLASGSFSGLTGKVDSEGHFRLYAISGSAAGNSVVTLTDTAAFNAAPVTSGTQTVTTAPAGNAYRGLAFAPEAEATLPGAPTGVTATAGNSKAELSWTAPANNGGSSITAYRITPFKGGAEQPSITTPSAATSYTVEGLSNGVSYTFTVAAINASGAGPASEPSAAVIPTAPGVPLPVISLSDEYLEGTNGDPTNPTVGVTVGQTGTPASELTVAATATSNSSVATTGGVTVEGSGASRTVSITPAGGVGLADITLRVTGAEEKSATVTLHYAASAPIADPATTRYHTGAADGSAAIDVGNGYMLIGDDENNTLRLYKDSVSGAPVKEWNFNSQMGNPEEIDIEASARAGNTIYWTGSMGNSKKGNLKPDRSVLFTTHISGEGAATELTFGGYYRGLRADLIKWDQEHGNRFGFAAGAAEGNVPKQINGFNVEGLEFAKGSTETAYVGFRAPLSPAKVGGDAILVPVTNLGALATSGQNTTLHATFGEPILMNLEGLSIRDIQKNAAGEYLILAGSWAATGAQALYTWDGVPADPPVKTLTTLPAAEGGGEDSGAWEGIAGVPDPLASGDKVILVMDAGASDPYGTGQEAKELIPEWEKSPSHEFTLQLPAPDVAPESTEAPTFAYEWQRDGTEIAGASAATYTALAADAGHQIRCVVTATNSVGSAAAPSDPVTIAAATCGGGPITGAGSSLQAAAQQSLWAPGFKAICGTGDEVTYVPSSSGAGLGAWGFGGGAFDASQAFVGSDDAPNPAQIANARAKSGSSVLTIPVAQTAIAIVVNPPSNCSITEITNKQLEGVMQGRIKAWSKVETAAGAGCVDAPITRVVRKEGSGTTFQLKNYLLHINEATLPCTAGAGQTWRSLEEIGTGAGEAPNTVWPQNSTETGCTNQVSELIRAEGGGGVVRAVNATNGSIGYAALPDVERDKNDGENGEGDTAWLKVQDNGVSTKLSVAKFAAPLEASAQAANCLDTQYPVPTPAQVGKKEPANADWSQIFGANTNAAAIASGAYSLCTLTYVEALTEYSKPGIGQAAEQTVKDYLADYVLAESGQEALEAGDDFYAPLPSRPGSPVYDILGAARFAASRIGF